MSVKILSRSFRAFSKYVFNENELQRVNTGFRFSSSYKAAVLDGNGTDTPFKITEVKSPKKLKKGQVRIKVRACSFNIWDYRLVSEKLISTIHTPGYEISGEVIESADAEEVAKGDKVIAFTKGTMGGFAQQIVVDEKDVWLKPSTVSSEEACTLLESYGTTILGLVKQNHLVEKQNVVVTLAMGQGFAPLDIAANVYKAKVIAVCENEGEDATALRERGAWTALAYTDKGLRSAVKDLTKGKGVSVAYSTMSGPTLLSVISCVSHGGVVLYGGCEDLPALSASTLITLPSFRLSPVSLWVTRNQDTDKYREAINDVVEMCEQNLISPTIGAKFKLEDINNAYKLLKEKRPIGKVVVTMDD